jgi:hypothetical protein
MPYDCAMDTNIEAIHAIRGTFFSMKHDSTRIIHRRKPLNFQKFIESSEMQ